MSPEFNASNIITVKRIMNFDAIPFGEPFFIITEEQRLLRYIRQNEKDPKTFILRASNGEGKFGDIVIKKSDIKFLFQVEGKITRR